MLCLLPCQPTSVQSDINNCSSIIMDHQHSAGDFFLRSSLRKYRSISPDHTSLPHQDSNNERHAPSGKDSVVDRTIPLEQTSQQSPSSKGIMLSTKGHIIALPTELRLMIYDLVLSSYELDTSTYNYKKLKSESNTWLCQLRPDLLLTCHLIRDEAMEFYRIRLLTIWHAQHTRMCTGIAAHKSWSEGPRGRMISPNITTLIDMETTDRMARLIRHELRTMFEQGYVLNFDEWEQIKRQLVGLYREYREVLSIPWKGLS